MSSISNVVEIRVCLSSAVCGPPSAWVLKSWSVHDGLDRSMLWFLLKTWQHEKQACCWWSVLSHVIIGWAVTPSGEAQELPLTQFLFFNTNLWSQCLLQLNAFLENKKMTLYTNLFLVFSFTCLLLFSSFQILVRKASCVAWWGTQSASPWKTALTLLLIPQRSLFDVRYTVCELLKSF